MNTWLAYGICFVIIGLTIVTTIKEALNNEDYEYSFNRVNYFFSVILAFFIMILNLERIYIAILKFSSDKLPLTEINPELVKIVGLLTVFFIMQLLINILLRILSSPFVSAYSFVFKRKLPKIVVSFFLGAIKGLIIIAIAFIGIISFNGTIGKDMKINIFSEVKAYNRLEGFIDKYKPIIAYDEIKDYIPANNNIIIYYNGVTIEDGVKSTPEIDTKARELVKSAGSQRTAAKILYSWVGANIEYDYDKAERTLAKENVTNSGALEAWNTRKGICFDYACLYVAMCRANGIKVRLITGQAFDGESYGPHAWNQVYLEEEGKWINVDPTFYFAGDYFDTADFDKEHKTENIAGEW